MLCKAACPPSPTHAQDNTLAALRREMCLTPLVGFLREEPRSEDELLVKRTHLRPRTPSREVKARGSEDIEGEGRTAPPRQDRGHGKEEKRKIIAFCKDKIGVMMVVMKSK